jgi:hypothetical protein
MLKRARCSLHKKRIGTCYAQVMFLHPVGCAGHVVHFGASEARNVIALIFMLEWDRYGFDKKCARTHFTELAFLHPVGYMGRVVHSGASQA